MSLENDDVKQQVISLKEQGYTSREIEDLTGVSKSSVNSFLAKDTYKDWWSSQDSIMDEDDGLEDLCNSSDLDVAKLAKQLRTAQKTNAQLRKVNNHAFDVSTHIPDLIVGVEKAVSRLNAGVLPEAPRLIKRLAGQDSCVVEILFSDWQVGKVGQYYNTKRAISSLEKYGNEVYSTLRDLEATDTHIDKIIFASLGDIVEDHLKHGVQSATSTDSGLSEQIATAIIEVWNRVLQPICSLGYPVEVVCVAGNHGSSQHKGMDMYKAGLYSYDYPIYKAWEGFCKQAGYNWTKFIIPEGCFAYTQIYGRHVVYEHGYFNQSTEKSMEDQRSKRSNQLKRHVEYFRVGDMHHVCNYDCGKLVVNGAFFGSDTEGVEYSGILGYNSVPAQVVMVHKDTDSVGRNTVDQFIQIQVADGY